MLSRCPDCGAAIRVDGPDHGRVRCGHCLAYFVARDHPAAPDAAPEPPDRDAGPPPDQASPDQALPDEAPTEPAAGVEDAPPPSGDAAPPAPVGDLAPVTDAPRAGLALLAWSVASLLLAAALAFQYTWFRHERLAAQYPDLRPYYRWLCARVACPASYRAQDVGAIRLASREVRGHPRVPGGILVNATIVNTGEQPQPFPLLGFSLFDTGGKRIAQRFFRPIEYLGDGSLIPDGMPPGVPVQVLMEIVGTPARGAVSYEFDFVTTPVQSLM